MIPAGIGFEYGATRYEVDARALRGVIAAPNATGVPGANERVVGVMSWRGTVLALVRPDARVCEVRAAVIVDAGSVLLAVAAERIEGYLEALTPERVLDPARVLRDAGVRSRKNTP